MNYDWREFLLVDRLATRRLRVREDVMKLRQWLYAGMVGLHLVGCAGLQTGPSPDAKAALAPAAKLRVAFVSTSIYATKDPKTGELKGVGIDLGQDLARRLGVPFEPIVDPNVSALIAAARAGEVSLLAWRQV